MKAALACQLVGQLRHGKMERHEGSKRRPKGKKAMQKETQRGVPKIGIPQNGWFIMENLIKMDDLGGKPTIFGNPHLLQFKDFYFLFSVTLLVTLLDCLERCTKVCLLVFWIPGSFYELVVCCPTKFLFETEFHWTYDGYAWNDNKNHHQHQRTTFQGT